MKQRVRATFGWPALVLVAALAAVAPGAHAVTSPAKQIELKNIAFNPDVVTIKAGQRVTWTWNDPYTSHNIHSMGAPRFKGITSRQKGTYTVRFTKKGTYRYECTLHPGMRAKIIVK